MDFYEYEELLEQENRQILQHHGIFGQKWGRRNGPPYPIPDGKHSAAEKRENPELNKAPAKRSYKELSDKELRETNERLRLENEFVRQKYEQMKLAQGPQIQKGDNWLRKAANISGDVTKILSNANAVAKIFGFSVGDMIQAKLKKENDKADKELEDLLNSDAFKKFKESMAAGGE